MELRTSDPLLILILILIIISSVPAGIKIKIQLVAFAFFVDASLVRSRAQTPFEHDILGPTPLGPEGCLWVIGRLHRVAMPAGSRGLQSTVRHEVASVA